MGELQALLSQRETLAEQLRRIAETCEGLENESNAAQVALLNEEQLKLTATKNELQGKVAGLEKQLLDLSRKINELSGSGVDRILNAIKNQRWFFFKNKPKVLMDRDTAILWANLQYLSERPHTNNYVNVVNNLTLDGYKGWSIPSKSRLNALASFANQLHLPNEKYWSENRHYDYLNGSFSDTSGSGTYRLLPLNSVLRPKDYEQNISPINTIYSEKEKLLMTLNVFVTNGLEPIFNDAAITELFRQIYIVKPEVQRQLTEIQQQIERLNEVELISPKLDWLALKTKFDMGANASPVRYAESLKNLTEHLLEKFDDYTAEKSAALDELIKLSPPNELVPNVKSVRADLVSFHDDALDLTATLLKTSGLMRLTELLAETRPPFETVTELLTEKVRQVLLKVEFFELQPEFVRSACAALNQKFEFRSEYLRQFHIIDHAAQKVLANLIRYVKAGHLQKKVNETLTAAEIALNHLQSYREEVAALYKKSPNDNPPKEEIALCIESLQKNFAEVASLLDEEKERHRVGNLHRPISEELALMK
ncbi:MAG: hypothetical protein IJG33_09185 [Selenomonadaceae bacterium]|nr:hypothetical protein [Selenomonadaceae bacterium]